MKSFKTLLSVTITVLLLLSTFAYAEEIRPYADPEFQQVFITLYSDGAADFECTAYKNKSSLYVKNCQLQKKEGNRWVNVGESTTGEKLKNANSYLYTIDYSDQITSGTYRVKGTFVADNYNKTKYSAERTF